MGKRCEYCGAGDDAHHSYTCPTGKHPDREFVPEYFSGLNWRDAKKLVGKVVEFSDDGDCWSSPHILDIVVKDEGVIRKFITKKNAWLYIRTTPETYQDNSKPTDSGEFNLHDIVIVYDRYRFGKPLKAKIVEFSSLKNDVRLLTIESNNRKYPKGCSNVWVHKSQIRKTKDEAHAHPTITIGGVELPRPETVAPAIGTRCWVFDLVTVIDFTWRGTESDRAWLKAKIIHLTEDRAQAWADYWQNTVMAAVKGGE